MSLCVVYAIGSKEGCGPLISNAVLLDVPYLVNLFKQTINPKQRMVERYMRKHVIADNIRVIREDGVPVAAYIRRVNRVANPYTRRTSPRRIGWLEQLMVLPEFQRTGLGHEMMTHFLHLPVQEFRLVCKSHLIQYYERFDFTVCDKGIHKNEPYYIMSKII